MMSTARRISVETNPGQDDAFILPNSIAPGIPKRAGDDDGRLQRVPIANGTDHRIRGLD
jgi:hypothetical protein